MSFKWWHINSDEENTLEETEVLPITNQYWEFCVIKHDSPTHFPRTRLNGKMHGEKHVLIKTM